MVRVSESTVIERPPAEVFEVAADPHEQLKWDPETLKSVEKLTPGPLGRGSRYRGEFKGFGTVEYEFDEFERGRRFTHHMVMNLAEIRHIFGFEEVPKGTRLMQSIEAEPRGVWKLMAPIMRMMFRRRLRAINSELSQYLGHAPADDPWMKPKGSFFYPKPIHRSSYKNLYGNVKRQSGSRTWSRHAAR